MSLKSQCLLEPVKKTVGSFESQELLVQYLRWPESSNSSLH